MTQSLLELREREQKLLNQIYRVLRAWTFPYKRRILDLECELAELRRQLREATSDGNEGDGDDQG